ncbi:MAG: hypothetical protein ACKOSS_03085 [Planctomycetia bacterium]
MRMRHGLAALLLGLAALRQAAQALLHAADGGTHHLGQAVHARGLQVLEGLSRVLEARVALAACIALLGLGQRLACLLHALAQALELGAAFGARLAALAALAAPRLSRATLVARAVQRALELGHRALAARLARLHEAPLQPVDAQLGCTLGRHLHLRAARVHARHPGTARTARLGHAQAHLAQQRHGAVELLALARGQHQHALAHARLHGGEGLLEALHGLLELLGGGLEHAALDHGPRLGPGLAGRLLPGLLLLALAAGRALLRLALAGLAGRLGLAHLQAQLLAQRARLLGRLGAVEGEAQHLALPRDRLGAGLLAQCIGRLLQHVALAVHLQRHRAGRPLGRGRARAVGAGGGRGRQQADSHHERAGDAHAVSPGASPPRGGAHQP